MTLFTDGVQSALERAMDGVAQRQRVTAQNIANVMTPGYHAQRVTFENDLARALNEGANPLSAAITVEEAGGQPDERGNTVDLATESTTLMRSGLEFDALVQAANYRHNILRAAIR